LIEFFRRPDNQADPSITDCLTISVGCHVVHRFRIIQSNNPSTFEASGNLGEGDAWAGAYFQYLMRWLQIEQADGPTVAQFVRCSMGHYAAGQTANKTMWPAKLTNEVFLHLSLHSSPKSG
jgi:hypothetical protein